MSNILIEPFQSKFIGDLRNRVVMSPMTRGFSDNGHLCTPEMAAYYERRAEYGVALIITEAIVIHPSADGYKNVPHLHTNEQMEGWRRAVESVHKWNSKIYAQLWHCGRISHPEFIGGLQPVSSTNKQGAGLNRQNNKPFGVPRPLAAEEMLQVYQMFMDSAEFAFQSGFDGVQLHMGHGYLIDQFLDARVNDRLDNYGGSVENRCRFACELLDLMIKRFGAEKIMVRISPSRMMDGLYEWPDMVEMLSYLIKEFDRIGLRQLDVSCANANYYATAGRVVRNIRKIWPYLLVGGASLSIEDANNEINDGHLDMVTWGRLMIANPDFVTKIKDGLPLTEFDNDMRNVLF